MNAMRGTILWNIGLGAAGFLITMLASSATNLWSTSITRGLLAFVVWFMCGYGVRFVAQLLSTKGQPNTVRSNSSKDASAAVGAAVNYTTPDDAESLYQMLHSSSKVPETSEEKESPAKEEFQPLTPPRFVTKPLNDEQMAQAVRYLNDK